MAPALMGERAPIRGPTWESMGRAWGSGTGPPSLGGVPVGQVTNCLCRTLNGETTRLANQKAQDLEAWGMALGLARFRVGADKIDRIKAPGMFAAGNCGRKKMLGVGKVVATIGVNGSKSQWRRCAKRPFPSCHSHPAPIENSLNCAGSTTVTTVNAAQHMQNDTPVERQQPQPQPQHQDGRWCTKDRQRPAAHRCNCNCNWHQGAAVVMPQQRPPSEVLSPPPQACQSSVTQGT
ncbi:hypothetical protein K402DRAFT_405420 [Aulographum hederae CBS 113979]|uniref:Uncharacterized protein n=1 Tax=Aulographum hederae CBS 113979 TaxID=1176131 RepID=A0A6G1GWU7_9PEZI|nr:hypothetical protein K402DRAFT_405420 [Aulographum hederae CBS 113979]